MGVYKLGKQFLGKITGPGEIQKLEKIAKINHFFLDINGILHNVAQWTFVYRNTEFDPKRKKEREQYMERLALVSGIPWKELMMDYEQKLFETLNRIMGIIKPDRTICLCVDGVAPAAKISQQRVRRYAGANSKLTVPKAETGFSSTFITPGTEFMVMVDKLLLKWVSMNKSKYRKIRHIYSSHMLPGEGEHKIFQIIDRYNIGSPADNYAIEGLDSDLVSLTILRPQHFFLIRMERKEFIDMNGFKEYVISTMKKDFSRELILKDFVLILYIVGNDFLPRFLFVDDVGNTLNLMMECYANFVKIPLTTSNNTIQWTSLNSFFNCLSRVETELLMNKSMDEYAYEHPVVHSEKAKDLAFSGDSEKYMNKVSNDLYDYILRPSTALGHELTDDCDIESEINRLCKDLCKGLLWVLRYYTGSTRSNSYLFEYQNAPLIADLWKYIMTHIDTNDFQDIEDVIIARSDDKFNAISQLMAVVPNKYNSLIPEPFNLDMLPRGRFNYLNPVSFPIKREGLKELSDEFMEKPVLPIVPSKELVKYVNENRELWDPELTDLMMNAKTHIM